jgi:hypothetical protein
MGDLDMTRALRACLSLLAVSISTGCYDPPDIHVGMPEPPPRDKDGWAIWSIPDPMLVLVEGGAYRVFMRCSKATWGIELNVPPAPGAVQPPMTIEFNDIRWTGSPKEKVMGGSPPFVEAKIVVDGESPSRDTLAEGLRKNTHARIAFNGTDKALPPIPADLGARVAGYCLKVL